MSEDPSAQDRSRWQDALQVLFFVVFARPFLALFVGLRLRGARRLPGAGPLVVVANHASHLDTLTLLRLFPLRSLRHVRPVAAADYFLRNPLVAWASRTFFHILPIVRHRSDDPDGPDPIQQMLAALDRQEILVIFPEGTRGSGEGLAPFHLGIGRVLEQRPEVPVVCVGLRNTGRSLPKGAWIPVPIFVDAEVTAPRRVQGSAEEIVTGLRDKLASMVGATPE